MSTKKPAILLVEDEAIIAMGIQLSLEGMGYRVTGIAPSAKAAVRMSLADVPDLVLMDIHIKGEVDGVTCAEMLHERMDVPVVFMTAYSDAGTVERAVGVEPHGYLVKPVSDGALRSAVELALYRKALERKAREQQAWQRTTLDSIVDAVLCIDLDGALSYVNPAAETLLGLPKEQVLGRPVGPVVRALGLDPEAHALASRVIEEQSEVEGPSGLTCGGKGKARMLTGRTSPVTESDTVYGAVMVLRDETEQQAREKQFELLDRLASLGSLAASVAHEINNPLTVFMGEVEMMQETIEEAREAGQAQVSFSVDELREILADMKTATERVTRVVRDLKDFTRPPQRMDGVADVARAAAWALRMARNDLRNRARVSVDVPSEVLVAMEETRLGQVLTNLVVNATHAIAPGHVSENLVSLRLGPQEDGLVVIEVEDTGEGIAPESIERIFEPFFTTKPREIGTGLGLAICRSLVEEAGGSLSVESELGGWTRFTLRVPRVTSAPDVAQDHDVSEPIGARVLIVDDESSVAGIFGRILRDCDVTVVPCVRDAMELIRARPGFDVILSDLMMPDGTGKDFYEELLETAPELGRRFLVCTGGALSPGLAAFCQTLPNRPVSKPVRASELRERVREVLEART